MVHGGSSLDRVAQDDVLEQLRDDKGGHGRLAPAEHDPATVRAQELTLSQPLSEAIRGHFEDPWHAWFLLSISILAVSTQIALRIVHDGNNKPDTPIRALTDEGQAATQLGMGSLVARGAKNSAGTAAASPEQTEEHLGGAACSPFDEDCHARMLDYAEAASYGADTSTTLFYTELKDWVLYMIFFVSLYAFCYLGLARYRRRRRTSASTKQQEIRVMGGKNHQGQGSARGSQSWSQRQLDDDAVLLTELQEDDALPFALCSLSVAVALGSMLLVPMTILDSLLRKYLSHEDIYGGLASTDLGFIWHMLFYVSSACHFIVLPFAFLYTESEGLGMVARCVCVCVCVRACVFFVCARARRVQVCVAEVGVCRYLCCARVPAQAMTFFLHANEADNRL